MSEYKPMKEDSCSAVIKVVGVGGGGGNAVKHMIQNRIPGVEFICANTDRQALVGADGARIIQIGTKVTKGLGAGTDPAVGRDAAMEDRDSIIDALQGADMVFITTGMGGGTGTGATPIIAAMAKELGILTIAVVTRPFPFEGKRRARYAEEGIMALAEHVDSLITIPNEKLMTLLGKDAPLTDAFAKADDVLASAVSGISNLINLPGTINVDFADVRAVMSEMGMALMGSGIGSGPNRASDAANEAIHNPLLSNVDLRGAKGFLVNISAADNISLGEYASVGNIIEEYASEDARVKIGVVIDDTLGDELHVTVVATGLDMVGSKGEKEHKRNSHAPIHSRLSDDGHNAPVSRAPEQYESHDRAPMRERDSTYHQRDTGHHQREMATRTTGNNGHHQREMATRTTGNTGHHDYRHEEPISGGHQMDRNPISQGREAVQIAASQKMPMASRDPLTGHRPAAPQPELHQAMGNDESQYLDIPAFLRRGK